MKIMKKIYRGFEYWKYEFVIIIGVLSIIATIVII